MRLALGLDGGGTKAACLLADERGRVLGYGLGGPTNVNFVARRTAAASVRQAVRKALARADLPRVEIAVARASHAGPDWAAAARSVAPVGDAREIGEHDPVRAACMGDGPGVVIIAGTGATAIGWDRRGRQIGVGGWGSPLGDEGGAYETALHAIRAAIHGEDGRGEPTALGRAVCEHFKIARLGELPRLFYRERVPRHVVSGLCPRVVEAAQEGDAVARKVLAGSGQALGLAAGAAIRRLRLGRSRVEVVVAGGLSRVGPLLMGPLRREVRRAAPRAEVKAASREPVVGCLLLAVSCVAGRSTAAGVDERLRAAVDASMEALGLLGWPGPERKPDG